jgi:hypothetical protein
VRREVVVHFQKPYVVARLVGEAGDTVAMGVARCSAQDDWSPKTGVRIAIARAFEDFWCGKANEAAGVDEWRANGWPDRAYSDRFVTKVMREYLEEM